MVLCLHHAAFEAHTLDGAFGGAHAAGDVHALESRTRSGRGGLQMSVARQDHLAIGADVHEQRDAFEIGKGG